MNPSDFQKIRLELLHTLDAAQQLRYKRPRQVWGVSEWAAFERLKMWEAVNKYRLQRNKVSILIDRIKCVERIAFGHSDYSEKFALYCAELVVED